MTLTPLLFPLLTTALIPNPLLTPRHVSPAHLRKTALHQVLQPQKGGIVVDAPPDGFIARDPLLDIMMGRAEGSSSSDQDANQGDFDDVILGGNPTFSSRSSGQFAPQTKSAPRPPQRPPGDDTLPLFPDLKNMSPDSGPRRVSVGESAVFERRVGKSAPAARANNVASPNAYGPSGSASGGNFGNPNGGGSFGFNSPGGVSIKGDSSIFSSTGFVGGGGSTNVFSGGSGAGGATTTGFSSGIASGGPGSRSRATSSNFNTGNIVSNGARNDGGNVGNSFRDGTGRVYNSSFGNVARNAGQSRGGVNIKGDSSIFSSSGFVGGGGSSGYDTSGTRGPGGMGQSGMRPPTPPPRNTPRYNAQHVFDAPPRQPPAATEGGNAYSTPNNYDAGQFNGVEESYSAPTPQSFNTGQTVSNGFDSNPYYSAPIPPQTNNYNSGSSLADNFLTTKTSVRRSGPVPGGDDDYDPDDEMLGYDSPTRRGDGFLTEPEPQFVNMPIHTGKWMSELYLEQGLDVFSGGAAGFGVVKGDLERGSGANGSGHGGNNAYASGFQDNSDYGNGSGYSNNGYGSGNSGYGNSGGYGNNNPGYPNNNNGYGNNGGGYQSGGSFDRFGQTPIGGY